MKKIKSLTGRFGSFGSALTVLAMILALSSCRRDFDLDKRFPEWLGTSIYETLYQGFDAEVDGVTKHYTFKYYAALIDSLGYKNVLAKTGSKTIFVADDEAFERFLEKCPLAGNRKVEFKNLTKAQMKMILYGSMIDNVYQVAALSNSEGPTIGTTMRRMTTSSIYDSIRVIYPKDMPSNDYWNRYKNDPAGMVIFEDGTKKPMIVFTNAYLKYKGIKDDDYDFLFNQGQYPLANPSGKPSRQDNEASINGTKIMIPNKKCFNGFIHVMEDVIYLLPSMAEYLANSDTTLSPRNTSIIWSSILDRFSVPYFVKGQGSGMFPVAGLTSAKTHLAEINRLLGKEIDNTDALAAALAAHPDSVFTKMYLSKRHQGSYSATDVLNKKPIGGGTLATSSLLKFDPGWNSYFVKVTSDANKDMQQNMAAMIVPTDSALMAWWLSPANEDMRTKYGIAKYKTTPPTTPRQVAEDMSAIDMNVIVKLVNNNMLTSLASSVPSKFKDVMNDAQDPLFEDVEQAKRDISKVVICCNGAIYFTDYINTPTTYKSVAYPALVNEKLKVVDWAVEDETMGFCYYLNSMSAVYSLFLPEINTSDTLKAELRNKLLWVDPVSFALERHLVNNQKQKLKVIAFGYDDTKQAPNASIYDYDGTSIGDVVSSGITSSDFMRNRLTDLLDYHIVVTTSADKKGVETDVVDKTKYAYFRTKGGGAVRFKKGAVDPKTQFDQMEVAGGWQIEKGQTIKILNRYDMIETARGNGVTYVIDGPLQTAHNSVYDILSDKVNYPEFTRFFNLMDSTDFFGDYSNEYDHGSERIMPYFSTFNYTLYIPTSASVQALINNKKLRTPTEIIGLKVYWDSIATQLFEVTYAANEDAAKANWKDSMLVFSKNFRGATAIERIDSVFADSVSASMGQEHVDNSRFEQYFFDVEMNKIKNFIRYHIQDNSVYINAEFNRGSAYYQTAYMRESDKQFVRLHAVSDNDGIVLTDANSNVRNVKTDDAKYYNIMCREYQMGKGFDASKTEDSKGEITDVSAARIETSSYAVIHLIDGPLCNGEVNF